MILKPGFTTNITAAYQDGKLIVNHFQDCTDIVEQMKRLRNDGENKKSEFRLFASIPNAIVLELKTKGIDIFRMNKDPDMRRRFLREMQYNYKDFKAVNWKHLAR